MVSNSRSWVSGTAAIRWSAAASPTPPAKLWGVGVTPARCGGLADQPGLPDAAAPQDIGHGIVAPPAGEHRREPIDGIKIFSRGDRHGQPLLEPGVAFVIGRGDRLLEPEGVKGRLPEALLQRGLPVIDRVDVDHQPDVGSDRPADGLEPDEVPVVLGADMGLDPAEPLIDETAGRVGHVRRLVPVEVAGVGVDPVPLRPAEQLGDGDVLGLPADVPAGDLDGAEGADDRSADLPEGPAGVERSPEPFDVGRVEPDGPVFVVRLDDRRDQILVSRCLADAGDAGIRVDEDKGEAALIAGVAGITLQCGKAAGSTRLSGCR